MKNRFKAVLGRVMDEGNNTSQRGFTLIELLVVVLIIGILASIALPQYERAVEKSRVTEAKTTIKSIATALKARYLAEGYDGGSNFASFDELDLTFTDENGNPATGYDFRTKNWYYNISNFPCRDKNGNQIFQGINANNRQKGYEIYYCEAQGFVCNDWGNNTLCKSAGFTNKKSTFDECISVGECYAE